MKRAGWMMAVCALGCTGEDPSFDTDETGYDGTSGPCVPAEGDAFDSRPIDGAEFRCDDGSCILSLPPSEPTRPWAILRVAPGQFALTAFDQPEVIIASERGVYAVSPPVAGAFDVGAGRVWWGQPDEIVVTDTVGAFVGRCALPDTMQTLGAMGYAADRLFVNGLSAEREVVEVYAGEDGWVPFETATNAWRYREYAPGEVLMLGYGYAEWQDLGTGDSVLVGGSDDDFSAAAVCGDGTWWVGGGTGRVMRCTDTHACEYIEADIYPFQSEAYGCDEDGSLWWLEHPNRRLLTTGGEWRSEPMPSGQRTGTEQYGRQWMVVDAE